MFANTSKQGEAITALSKSAINTPQSLNVSPDSEKSESTQRIREVPELLRFKAEYGVLPEDHIISKYLNHQLRRLLPDLTEDEMPRIEVLGRTGLGVNACAFSNRTIVISPELIRHVQSTEELDYFLLHESVHILHEHHTLFQSYGAMQLKERFGFGRFLEIDADVTAFHIMSNPLLETSPNGAIRALQRLAELPGALQAWDPDHGRLQHRALALQGVALMMEVDTSTDPLAHSLFKEPTPIPNDIVEAAQIPLAGGGRVNKILNPPSRLRSAYDKWADEVIHIIGSADRDVIRYCVPEISKKLRALEEKIELYDTQNSKYKSLIDNRQHLSVLLVKLLKRYEELIHESHDHLTREEKEMAVSIGCFTELGMSFKEYYLNRHKSSVTFKGALRSLLDLQNEGQKELFTRIFSDCRNPFKEGAAYQFVSELSGYLVNDGAAFDTESGSLNIDSYLKWCSELTQHARHLEERYSYNTPSFNSQTEASTYSRAVLYGAQRLLELDSLNQSYIEAANLNMTESYYQIVNWPTLNEFCNEMKRAGQVKQAETLERFFVDKCHLKTVEQIKLRLKELDREFHAIKTSDPNSITLDAPEIFSIIKEVIDLSRELNHANLSTDTKRYLMSSQGERYFDLEGEEVAIHFVREIDRETDQDLNRGAISIAIAVLQLTTRSIDTYERAIYSSTFHDQIIKYISNSSEPYREFDEIHREICDFKDNHKKFMLKSNISDSLEHDSASLISGARIYALAEELKHNPKVDTFFEMLKDCSLKSDITSCLILNEDSILIFEGIERKLREITRYGLDLISETDQKIDSADLEKLLLISFYLPDQGIKSLFQTYLAKRIAEELPLKEAIDILSTRYLNNLVMVSGESIKILDQRASTPEELEILQKGVTKMYQSKMALKASGGMIGAEVVSELLGKRVNRYDLFKGLIESAYDETQLCQTVGHGWWKIYDGFVKDQIEFAINTANSIKKLEELDKEDLYVLDNRINGNLQFVPLRECIDRIYRLSASERYSTLLELLTGSHGILKDQSSRMMLAQDLLQANLEEDNSGERAVKILDECVSATITASNEEDLALVLSSILYNQICNQPSTQYDFSEEIKKHTHSFLNGIYFPGYLEKLTELFTTYFEFQVMPDLNRVVNEDEFHKIKDIIINTTGGKDRDSVITRYEIEAALLQTFLDDKVKKFIESAILGISLNKSTKGTIEERIFSLIPANHEDDLNRKHSPINFAIEFGTALLTPGIRGLQIMGQLVDIPDNIAQEFSEVYDSIEGQTKFAAWHTIRSVLPEYAKEIAEIGERLGGGSLYSVFHVRLKDGSEEVVRVLNPNAWYNTQRMLRILRAAQEKLASDNPIYANLVQGIDLIEEWIKAELGDLTFEEDDKLFRESHSWGKAEYGIDIKIPKSTPTGTVKVRREEYIKGKTFSSIHELPLDQQKRYVSSAVKHYISQFVVIGEDKLTRVHSDISVGNLMITEDNQVAILDRGLYLKFSQNEIDKIWKILSEQDENQSAEHLIELFSNLNENRNLKSTVNFDLVQERLINQLSEENRSQEYILQRLFLTLQDCGLVVPLRYRLLLKGLNAFAKLCRKVGYSGIMEAAFDT